MVKLWSWSLFTVFDRIINSGMCRSVKQMMYVDYKGYFSINIDHLIDFVRLSNRIQLWYT